MNIGEVVRDYITLRNKLSDARKDFEAYEATVKGEMAELETKILGESNRLGVTSFATPYGTAYTTTKSYAGVEDAEARIEYAKRTGDFGLFTNHVNKKHVEELIEDGVNIGEIGLVYTTEKAINIRKK